MGEKYEPHEPDEEGNQALAEFKPGDLVTISPQASAEYLMGRGMQELKAGETYRILKIEELEDVEEEGEFLLSAYLAPADADMTLLQQYSSGEKSFGGHYPASILPLKDLIKTTIQ